MFNFAAATASAGPGIWHRAKDGLPTNEERKRRGVVGVWRNGTPLAAGWVLRTLDDVPAVWGETAPDLWCFADELAIPLMMVCGA
jgi:hypothetical protein